MTQPYPAEAVERLKDLSKSFMTDREYGPPMGDNEISPRADLAALLSYVESMKWRPIESAPKDGTRLLSHIANNGRVIIRWANKFSAPHYGDSESGWYCETLDRRVNPTNWLPLPPAPDSEG